MFSASQDQGHETVVCRSRTRSRSRGCYLSRKVKVTWLLSVSHGQDQGHEPLFLPSRSRSSWEQHHHGEQGRHHVFSPARLAAEFVRVAPPVVRRAKLARDDCTQPGDHATAQHHQHDERYQSANHTVTDDLMGDQPPRPIHRHRARYHRLGSFVVALRWAERALLFPVEEERQTTASCPWPLTFWSQTAVRATHAICDFPFLNYKPGHRKQTYNCRDLDLWPWAADNRPALRRWHMRRPFWRAGRCEAGPRRVGRRRCNGQLWWRPSSTRWPCVPDAAYYY